MKFADLIEGISYRLAGNPNFDYLSQEVDCVTADRHRSGEGTLFVCVRNSMGNGHDAADVAYAAGCRLFLARRGLALPDDAAVLVVKDTEALLSELASRCLGYPARSMMVFGITGTAGKSAVAHTLTALLRGAGYSVASLTTDGVSFGEALRPAGNIVPDGAEIQGLLREFADAGTELVVLEFSSYMLANKSHSSIPFAALLLTNLTPAHIGSGEHRDLAAYRSAKASLFASDAPFWVCPANLVDFPPNGDLHPRRLTFGDGGDLQAVNLEAFAKKSGFGNRFDLRFPDGAKEPVSLPVPGEKAVENALAAAALATIAGLSPKEIANGLSTYMPCGRLECVGAYEGRFVYTDAAYTATDLSRALETLRTYTRGKLTVLLGSVGGRARERRKPLGEAAAHADFVYLTADDPDCEDPAEICRDIAMGIADSTPYCILPDRRRAILRAVLEMRPGDTLLLAGKGGEIHQLIRSRREAFSEREIVAEALRGI